MPNLISRPKKFFDVRESWQAAAGTYDLHAVSAGRFVPNSADKTAAFTVQPGDKYLGSSGERAEIVVGRWNNSDRFKISGQRAEPEFYRVSVRCQVPWTPPDVNEFGFAWGIFFQIHGPDEFGKSPALALHAEDGFYLSVFGGNVVGGSGSKVSLAGQSILESGWVDFVVEVLWRTSDDGYVRVLSRPAGVQDFAVAGQVQGVPTLQWSGIELEHIHYIKYGFYRSESDHINSVQVGELRRSSSFEAAAA